MWTSYATSGEYHMCSFSHFLPMQAPHVGVGLCLIPIQEVSAPHARAAPVAFGKPIKVLLIVFYANAYDENSFLSISFTVTLKDHVRRWMFSRSLCHWFKGKPSELQTDFLFLQMSVACICAEAILDPELRVAHRPFQVVIQNSGISWGFSIRSFIYSIVRRQHFWVLSLNASRSWRL